MIEAGDVSETRPDDNQHECGQGALKSPDDPNDFIFERIACAPEGYYYNKFPDEHEVDDWLDARDQSHRSTCAAFVGAKIKEIHERSRAHRITEYMSPEFIYYHRDNKPASGMYGRNVFQILQKIGCVPEAQYPYLSGEAAPQPPEELYATAALHRIANYARVMTVDGLKRALLELGPCYLQLPLYSTRPCFWRPAEGETPSGHALVVVGYNKEGFRLVNSWGPTWNGDGTIIFPFDEWSAHWECWASVDKVSFDSPIYARYAGVEVARRPKRLSTRDGRRVGKEVKDSLEPGRKRRPRTRSSEHRRVSDEDNVPLLGKKTKGQDERCSVM
jgi:hypothetical protein